MTGALDLDRVRETVALGREIAGAEVRDGTLSVAVAKFAQAFGSEVRIGRDLTATFDAASPGDRGPRAAPA